MASGPERLGRPGTGSLRPVLIRESSSSHSWLAHGHGGSPVHVPRQKSRAARKTQSDLASKTTRLPAQMATDEAHGLYHASVHWRCRPGTHGGGRTTLPRRAPTDSKPHMHPPKMLHICCLLSPASSTTGSLALVSRSALSVATATVTTAADESFTSCSVWALDASAAAAAGDADCSTFATSAVFTSAAAASADCSTSATSATAVAFASAAAASADGSTSATSVVLASVAAASA